MQDKRETFIISRTDKIGDVVLTLPMAGILKSHFPNCHIIFLGQKYTKNVISLSQSVDEFWDWEEVSQESVTTEIKERFKEVKTTFLHVFPQKKIAQWAKKVGFQNRVGTSRRLYHFLTCNQKIKLSRKKSDLHESQLNSLLLVKTIENYSAPSLENMKEFYTFPTQSNFTNKSEYIDSNKINIILHPKSFGSAREWPTESFLQLALMLTKTNKYRVLISGTVKEEADILSVFETYFSSEIVNMVNKLSLSQFIDTIQQADALVAASTGPLHIASALGKKTVGIYPPIVPMHKERWGPVGKYAEALDSGKRDCSRCTKGGLCACMGEVSVESVFDRLEGHFNKYPKAP